MYRYNQKLHVQTLLGDIKEGQVKEVANNGYWVEIDEQILPNLNEDLIIHDSKNRPHVIYKAKFPNWQAWVPKENVLGVVKERVDVV